MPIPVLTLEQMRSWEDQTWASGIAESEVIDRVGQAIADWLLRRTRPGDRLLILAGRGHNGDDGRAAARRLPNRKVAVLDVSDPEPTEAELERALERRPAVIVDGLFGIGLNRELSESWQAFLNRINRAPGLIVAIDLPSGLQAAEGRIAGTAIRADYTLTVGTPKTGMLSAEARPYVGYLRILSDVGLIERTFTSDLAFSQESDFRELPPRRRPTDHKGRRGHLSIVAGSVGYHGAAVLAARSALRAQPGLVTLTTLPECYGPVAAQLQQAMVNRWNENWTPTAGTTGMVFGPGLADPQLPEPLIRTLQTIWRHAEYPVLADASALDWLPEATRPNGCRVVTPHPGEAARILNAEPAEIVNEPVTSLRRISEKLTGSWVVLKGHHSSIGRDRGPVWFNATGTPGLAQGGSGDVLAGFLGGLLAQPAYQKDPGLTLRYGVWQHGKAAERLAEARRNWIVEELPDALAT